MISALGVETVGVEEEYLLLDGQGLPAARAREVLLAASAPRGPWQADLQHELLQAQVEVATGVCTTLDEVRAQLTDLRRVVAAAAERAGCRLATVGAAPFVDGVGSVPVTEKPRYQGIHDRAPGLVEEQLINGMHVHVGVDDRTEAVGVVNRIRAWMPLVLAISANSPVWQGRDSGFASWRGIHFARWPVEGPPPAFADLEDHERRVEALLGTGAVMDRGQLYWHVRLSERYPTVEIRVADVQLDVETAVVLAGVIRALVVIALAEHRADGMLPVSQAVPLEVLRAATWRAARDGLAGQLADLRAGGVLPAARAIERLLEYVDDALAAAGDQEVVSAGLRRVLERGTGAQAQRSALADGGDAALIDLITAGAAAAR